MQINKNLLLVSLVTRGEEKEEEEEEQTQTEPRDKSDVSVLIIMGLNILFSS